MGLPPRERMSPRGALGFLYGPWTPFSGRPCVVTLATEELSTSRPLTTKCMASRGTGSLPGRGQFYRVLALPVGLATAPRILTAVMGHTVRLLCYVEIRVLPYLNDLIFAAATARYALTEQGCSNRESRESRGAKKRRFAPNREALNKIPNRPNRYLMTTAV